MIPWDPISARAAAGCLLLLLGSLGAPLAASSRGPEQRGYEGVPAVAWSPCHQESGPYVDVRYSIVQLCVAKGILVEAERGNIPIEDLRVGERVWSYNLESRKRVLSRITHIQSGFVEETVLFKCGLRVTRPSG